MKNVKKNLEGFSGMIKQPKIIAGVTALLLLFLFIGYVNHQGPTEVFESYMAKAMKIDRSAKDFKDECEKLDQEYMPVIKDNGKSPYTITEVNYNQTFKLLKGAKIESYDIVSVAQKHEEAVDLTVRFNDDETYFAVVSMIKLDGKWKIEGIMVSYKDYFSSVPEFPTYSVEAEDPEVTKEKKEASYRRNGFEYAIVGISGEELRKRMKEEKDGAYTEKINDFKIYHLDPCLAWVTNDKVVYLEGTRLGKKIHEGSKLDELTNERGNPTKKLDSTTKKKGIGNVIEEVPTWLYEYEFETISKQKGIVQFTINKNDKIISKICVYIPDEISNDTISKIGRKISF